jgi:hypothetical protein
MAQTAQINIKIDTSQANKSLDVLQDDLKATRQELTRVIKTYGDNSKEADKLRKSLTQLEVGIKKLGGSTTDLDAKFEDLYGDTLPLTGRLGEIEDRLYELSLAGQKTSQEFTDLLTEAGRLRQTMVLTDQSVDAMALTFSQKLSGGVGAALGAFTAFQGAAGLMIGENEELNDALLKVQSAMAVLQGYDAFKQSLPSLKALGSSIASIIPGLTKTIGLTAAQTTATGAQTVATTAQAAATGQATTAQVGLNATMLANPIFLVIAALTALVTAYIAFSGEAEKAEKMNEKLNASYERTTKELEASREVNERIFSNKIKLMELEGATDKELHDEKLRHMRIQNEETTVNIAAEKVAIEDGTKAYKQALKEENYELAKKISGELKQHKDKYNKLHLDRKQYYQDVKIENAEFDAEEKKKQEEAEEKALEKRKEYADKRKSVLDEVRRAEMDAADAKLSEEDREIVNTKRKWEKLIEDAKKYNIDTTKLKEGLREELATIDAKYDKIEADKIKENNQKYYDYLDSLEEDADTKRMMALDKEIAVLDEMLKNKTISLDNYYELTTNATDRAEKDITKIVKTEEDERLAKIKAAEDERLAKIKAGNDLRISYMEDGVDKEIAIRNQQYEDEKDNLKKSLDEKLISEDEYNNMLVIAAEKTSEDIAKITRDAQLKKAQEYADAITNFYSQLSSTITSIQQQRADSEKAIIDGLYGYEKEALENQLTEGIISKEQYDNKIIELDEKRVAEEEALARKSFEQQKKLQIANAVIQGTQAVLAAYSSGLATPLIGPATGAVYAAIAAAFAGIQINAIREQQFTAAGGGIVPGNGSGNVDSVPSLLAPGETVINAQSSAMYPELLNQVNMAGGGISLKPDLPAVNKNNSESRVFGDDKINQPLRAYVVETEITDTQKRVDRIKRSAEF